MYADLIDRSYNDSYPLIRINDDWSVLSADDLVLWSITCTYEHINESLLDGICGFKRVIETASVNQKKMAYLIWICSKKHFLWLYIEFSNLCKAL